MCFFFAQKYHTSMKYVGGIRRELGIRTVFNILGPLTNPASPDYMLLGVYNERLVNPLAKVMMSLGVKRGMVVYGTDCLMRFPSARRQRYVSSGTATTGILSSVRRISA